MQNKCRDDLDAVSVEYYKQISTHKFGHIIDCVVVRPDDDIHKKSTVTDSLETDHYCIKSYFNISVSWPSPKNRIVRNMTNTDRPSFIAELSNDSIC